MPDKVAGSVREAKERLRDQWQETGDTDAPSCPTCDATEFKWQVEDDQVRIRCEHCGYVDYLRQES